MSRTTTMLALLQVLLVVVGYFALGIVLKMSGYPNNEGWVHWNPWAVLLREHGGWLICLPVLWVLYATAAEHRDRGFSPIASPGSSRFASPESPPRFSSRRPFSPTRSPHSSTTAAQRSAPSPQPPPT